MPSPLRRSSTCTNPVCHIVLVREQRPGHAISVGLTRAKAGWPAKSTGRAAAAAFTFSTPLCCAEHTTANRRTLSIQAFAEKGK